MSAFAPPPTLDILKPHFLLLRRSARGPKTRLQHDARPPDICSCPTCDLNCPSMFLLLRLPP
eukprot:3873542-Alexandrium_andersonii.AAC.1